MLTGCRPLRSSRQAPPESASQQNTHSTRLRDTKTAAGAAIQRLRQLKQSISSPKMLRPSNPRNRTIMSAGPSSFASRCVTRQVPRTARTKRNQTPIPFIWASLARWLRGMLGFLPLPCDKKLSRNQDGRSLQILIGQSPYPQMVCCASSRNVRS